MSVKYLTKLYYYNNVLAEKCLIWLIIDYLLNNLIINCQSRKETNCLAVKEESYPKKNGKRRPDQKIPVCNVYSTSLKACQHQTVGKTAQPPCREGTIQKACPQLTGGTTYQPCKEGMSPKACQQRTGGTKVNPPLKEGKSPKACTQRTEGKTANPPLKEGMTPKACPQQTGGEKAYPPLKEGTCTTAFQQLTGGKTAFQTLKEGMTPNACPQQTGGKTAYPPLKEDTSPKAYQQQSDCLEEAIYLNNELETCDTGESLVWDGEETMYWNTGVASDRSSDSSGYIKMTL
ncbi:uncharacterized protein LOC134228807 [Saccostrea cucullata]|uniref:uncharacterized protein LOC134228807 n=1 Tax=Saccostrea cuccullata TaxID=36930 RepID=UPI002ED2F911